MRAYLNAMRPLLAAIAIVLVSAPGANALCVSYPDDASTNYTENTTSHAVCLQRELAEDTNAAAQQARLDAALGNLQIELDRQRQLLNQQLTQQVLPPTPSF